LDEVTENQMDEMKLDERDVLTRNELDDVS
jgi:hypothetical protein